MPEVAIAVRPPAEPVLEPELPIVDSHHHLWDRAGDRYLFDELLADVSSGHNIRASVFIECGAMYRRNAPSALRPVGEVEFVAGAAAMSASGAYGETALCAGIVGHVDLREAAWVDAALEQLQAASGGRLRGIRHSACWDADTSFGGARTRGPRGLLLDDAFRAGFSRLRPLALTFEAWLFHTQLPELTDLAQKFPTTTIVVNHIGGPLGAGAYAGRRSEVFESWRTSLRELAQCPNVVVKLGGLGMPFYGFGFERAAVPAASANLAEAWRPYLSTCIELFGADRCMFESNFPVDRPTATYATIWNAFKRIAASCSHDEKAALFSGTATRVYRLDVS
jgi:predicted TIM-barrel fold metal-dependent hydrolase